MELRDGKLYNEYNAFAVIVGTRYCCGYCTDNNLKPHCGRFIKWLFDSGYIKNNKIVLDKINNEQFKEIKDVIREINVILPIQDVLIEGLFNADIVWVRDGREFRIDIYNDIEYIVYKDTEEWYI